MNDLAIIIGGIALLILSGKLLTYALKVYSQASVNNKR